MEKLALGGPQGLAAGALRVAFRDSRDHSSGPRPHHAIIQDLACGPKLALSTLVDPHHFNAASKVEHRRISPGIEGWNRQDALQVFTWLDQPFNENVESIATDIVGSASNIVRVPNRQLHLPLDARPAKKTPFISEWDIWFTHSWQNGIFRKRLGDRIHAEHR